MHYHEGHYGFQLYIFLHYIYLNRSKMYISILYIFITFTVYHKDSVTYDFSHHMLICEYLFAMFK